jgi:DNA-binding transcriptional MerR regulator
VGSSILGRGSSASTVKLYYRIGEVAGIVGVEPHVLRYWETEFPSIRPQKSRSGQRVYSRRDVDKLLRVKELLYAQRFTIAGARQRLRESASSDETVTSTEAEVTTSVEPVVEAATVTAPVPTPDVRGSVAQSLRTALLGVRGDVSRLLDALNNRDNVAEGAMSHGACDVVAAPSVEVTNTSSYESCDEASVRRECEVARSDGRSSN